MNQLIHYIWFGDRPLPQKACQCLESWRRFFPEWEIHRWDEGNFDLDSNLYAKQASSVGKWAFASDYARFRILDDFGGLYFDTDVEVIREFGDILELEAFSAFENETDVNPGLVLYSCRPHQPVIHAVREWYEKAHFLDEKGKPMTSPNVCGIFKEMLRNYGFVANNQRQTCGGLTLFPKDYFCPLDDNTGILHCTSNTYSIHWYDKSWLPWHTILRNRFSRIIHRWFGKDIRHRLFK